MPAREGGSYAVDPKTGERKLTARTKPMEPGPAKADAAQAEDAKAPPSPPADATASGRKGATDGKPQE